MSAKRKDYSPFEVVDLGQLTQLTQGASGTKKDYDFNNGHLVPDPGNPTCTNNAGVCVELSAD
jgi:hypothetical protein